MIKQHFYTYFIIENYAPFLTGINIDNKKDFSLSFETFDVILSNVANEGN